MSSSECLVIAASVASPSALVRGPLCSSLLPASAIAEITLQETSDGAEFLIEPRTPMIFFSPLCGFLTENWCLFIPGVRPLLQEGMFFAPNFNVLLPGDMLPVGPLFAGGLQIDSLNWFPFRWMTMPAEVEAHATLRRMTDFPVDAEVGRLCTVMDFPVSGVIRSVTDLDVTVTPGLAAVDVTGCTYSTDDTFTTVHMVKPHAPVDGVVQTVRQVPVSVSPKGGVTATEVRLGICGSQAWPVDGRSQGEALTKVVVKPRKFYAVEIEVTVEVTG